MATYRTPLTTMRAYLDGIDTAFYTAPQPEPPVTRVLAALGPRMLELARDHTDGAHPYFATPEHTARAREVLGAGPFLAPEQTVVLSSDPEEARGASHAASRRATWGCRTTPTTCAVSASPTTTSSRCSDRVVDATVAWGDVDAIRARVQEHLDAGADHVCIQVLPREPGTLPLAEWRELGPALTDLG